MRFFRLVMIVVVLCMGGAISAQRGRPTPTPTDEPDQTSANAPTLEAPAPDDAHSPAATPDNLHAIQIHAEDGQRLAGEYFDGGTTAVLLLHELYTTHLSWGWFVEPLVGSGYSVLSVDLRGYGGSRGPIHWGRAQEDTQLWLDWLQETQGIRRVYIIGSSMGANLALVGCAESAICRGAVALSPSLHYFGVYTESAVKAGKPALLIYADRDPEPAGEVPLMLEIAEANGIEGLTTLVVPGRAHGMLLFDAIDDLAGEILAWLG